MLTRTKTRRLSKIRPKAKVHKPKRGKGSYLRTVWNKIVKTLTTDL